MCLLLELQQTTGNFLDSYKSKLEKFTDEELHTILSAVVVLLRRHSSENRLCCNNNENDLEVTGIDEFGFVTEVICKTCGQTMDTSCYGRWTKEIIHDNSKLKVGDHICWHRWYVIWHHAIVTKTGPLSVIEYTKDGVQENKITSGTCARSCDALYRINYEDCYNADYTTLRAQKLLDEKRYNLIERNCEHLSSWCKTGSTKSIQVSIIWETLAKIAFLCVRRGVAFLILLFLLWSQELSDQISMNSNTCNKSDSRNITEYNFMEYNQSSNATPNDIKLKEYNQTSNATSNDVKLKAVISAYVVLVTMIFMIYALITSGKRLQVDPRIKKYRRENKTSILVRCYDDCCCCCCCRYCCTCCRRPGNLACGLFCRIFLREIPGLIATLLIEWYEDTIMTNCEHLPFVRALVITFSIIAVQTGGYVLGLFLGRLAEACCEYSTWNTKTYYRMPTSTEHSINDEYMKV